MRRVVVTGLGAVTPLGVGVRRTWKGLLDGRCGIVSTSPLGPEFEALPSRVAGLVPKGARKDGGWNATEHVTATEKKQAAQFAHYGLAASAEALEDAGFKDGKGLNPEMTGVCLGSGIGNLEDLYDTSLAYGKEKNYRKIHPLFVPRLLINLGAAHISMRYGLKGPNHAVTTACTTGAHSLGDATRFIKAGDADVMIAGGQNLAFTPWLLADLPDREVWQPRSTTSLTDRLVLSTKSEMVSSSVKELEHAKMRGARIYAELAGYGSSADANHITAPPEDGAGALLAMQKALRSAEIPPSAVDYINAHATSTPLGDAAENTAISNLMLSEHGRRSLGEVNISSSKGAVGHLLGAAGAIEAVFTVLAVHENTLPPTINLNDPSDGFECNYVPKYPQQGHVDVALTNSFGFGGTNSALCFAKLR